MSKRINDSLLAGVDGFTLEEAIDFRRRGIIAPGSVFVLVEQLPRVIENSGLKKAANEALKFLTDEQMGTWEYMECGGFQSDRKKIAEILRASIEKTEQ